MGEKQCVCTSKHFSGALNVCFVCIGLVGLLTGTLHARIDSGFASPRTLTVQTDHMPSALLLHIPQMDHHPFLPQRQ